MLRSIAEVTPDSVATARKQTMWRTAVLVLGMLAGLGVGALVGLFNGVCVAWLRVNPFIATLDSLNICVGLATTVSGGPPGVRHAGQLQRAAERLDGAGRAGAAADRACAL